MNLEPLGDSAVVATLGPGIDEATLASVRGLAEALAAAKGKGIVDVVPAYATVTVFYDPLQFAESSEDAYASVCRLMEDCAARSAGGGPAAEAAALHSGADYLVHAVGFTPGFPYLGGLPEPLHTPRRETPRARVPAGSVGIGGSQPGVSPVASPGGWQIIGRTPVALFRPEGRPAALLKPGDRVRFKVITAAEFESWK